MIRREVAVHSKLIPHLLAEDLHLLLLTMYKHHIFRFQMRKQLEDSFRVSMRAETHVKHANTHIDVSIVYIYSFLSTEHLVSDSPRLTVAGYDQGVLFITCPFFEDL